jgi:hypothetical protein
MNFIKRISILPVSSPIIADEWQSIRVEREQLIDGKVLS